MYENPSQGKSGNIMFGVGFFGGSEFLHKNGLNAF